MKKRTKSQIGRQNRRKGGVGEREVVHKLMNNGTLAQRVSMLESGGISKGDVQFKIIATQKDWEISQVKNEIAVPEYLYKVLQGYRVAFLHKPHKKWLVLLDMDYFIKELL